MANQINSYISGAGPGNGAGNTWGSAWPRYLSALIALWLFISAFAWRHAMWVRQDTWIVGVLMFVSALIAIATPGFRWVNTVLSAWLFISTLVTAHPHVGTVWNNLIVACVVFLLSLIPSVRPPTRTVAAGHPT